jgi:hypothetical protein
MVIMFSMCVRSVWRWVGCWVDLRGFWFRDPASRSGVSVRTIGVAVSFGALLTVITVVEDGVVWGLNAWRSSDRDARKYREREV